MKISRFLSILFGGETESLLVFVWISDAFMGRIRRTTGRVVQNEK
jgi:hypothetical protein